MDRSASIGALLCLAGVVAAAPLGAQQPTQRQMDSLAREIQALKARLDSLSAALARRAGAPRDTGELAALRAAAVAAAERPDAARDTARQVASPRNLNQLNPEISVTGDFRSAVQTQGPQRGSFQAREFEFSFQSALDPYSHTKIFAAIEEGEIDIEEAYFYYTGLPGRMRLDLGRYRQQFGELNRWHLHAVPEAEYPLALVTYTGEEGLIGTGASAYWNLGALGTHELWAQITLGDNEALFADGDRLAYLAHLNNFWQLGRATYMQLGATGVYGTNPDSSLDTRLGGVDFRFTWRPPARARYREWNLRAEFFAIEKKRAGVGETRYGWYAGTNYKLGQRWIAGLRYDYVEAPEGSLAIIRQVVPSLTFWQSEWVKLHAEWQHRHQLGASDDLIVLQAVWSIGPHKHETY